MTTLSDALNRLSLRPEFNRYLAAKTDAEAVEGDLSCDLLLAAQMLRVDLGEPVDTLASLVDALLDELDRRNFDTLPWRASRAAAEAFSLASRDWNKTETEDEFEARLDTVAMLARARFLVARTK